MLASAVQPTHLVLPRPRQDHLMDQRTPSLRIQSTLTAPPTSASQQQRASPASESAPPQPFRVENDAPQDGPERPSLEQTREEVLNRHDLQSAIDTGPSTAAAMTEAGTSATMESFSSAKEKDDRRAIRLEVADGLIGLLPVRSRLIVDHRLNAAEAYVSS